MRSSMLGLLVLAMATAACGTASPGRTTAPAVEIAADVQGLERVDFSLPGELYLLDGHGIGGYDAFLIPAASIDYKRGSRQLPTTLELAFLASLEQTLVDAAEEAKIPVVNTRGQCVMEVRMDLSEVDLERAGRSQIGRMTLAMEFRDTLTDQPLLRYAREYSIPNEGDEVPRREQLQAAFAEMVGSMEIGGALRAAGLTNDDVRPGCNGTLAARGRAAGEPPPVSAR